VAAASAALLAAERPRPGLHSRGDGALSAPGPWDTLGAWRLGDDPGSGG